MQGHSYCSIWDIKEDQGIAARVVGFYHELSYDDHRTTQRHKIRNIKFPAIRCFTHYLASSVLSRENTSNISNYHLAFLAAALKNNKIYNLGALIARRLAAKGPIFGVIIVARVLADLCYSVDPANELMVLERLDLATMTFHNFVTTSSYKELFLLMDLSERSGFHSLVCSVFSRVLYHIRCRIWTSTLVHLISICSTTPKHRQETFMAP